MRDPDSQHPVDELLRKAAGDPTPSSADRSRAERALVRAIREEETARPAMQRRWRWTVPALAGSIAVILVAMVALQISGPSRAEAALIEIAAVVELTDPISIPEQSYAYTKSESIVRGVLPSDAIEGRTTPLIYLLPQSREVWVGGDGTVQIRTTAHQPVFFTAQDEAGYYAAGFDKIDRINETVTVVGVGVSSLLDDREWPTTPNGLEAAIAQSLPTGSADGFVEQHDVSVVNLALALITETAASPELKATAVRVISRLGGVDVDERRLDGGGTFSIASDQIQPTRLTFTLDGAGNVLRITLVDLAGDPAASIPQRSVVVDTTFERTTILSSLDSP